LNSEGLKRHGFDSATLQSLRRAYNRRRSRPWRSSSELPREVSSGRYPNRSEPVDDRQTSV
jgi:acyl-[acyl carrier protein]--UDP-N-acetylglucosamine O-acyltransferase